MTQNEAMGAPAGVPEEAPPRRRRGSLFWGGVTAAVVLVIVALVAGALAFMYHQGRANLAGPCDRYLAAANRGDFPAGYELLAQKTRNEKSLKTWVNFERATRVDLGPCRLVTLTGIYVNMKTAGALARLTYLLDFEHGRRKVTFRLLREAAGWTIEDVTYEPVT